MIWLSWMGAGASVAFTACSVVMARRLVHRRREPAEELWGPAKTALVEAEVLSPIDGPECPAVDTAYLRSEYSREQYERAYFETHGEHLPWIGRQYEIETERRALIEELEAHGAQIVRLPGLDEL